MVWTQQKQKILTRGGKNTQNCTKKIFMTQIIMMVGLKEETDRTGSILKAGLHLGPDSGL